MERFLNLFRGLMYRRVLRSDISDDECVACGSKELTSLGPNAYECNTCQYQGGSGLATMQADARFAVFDAWDELKRLASATSDLQEARTLLLAATGTWANALPAATHDAMGLHQRGSRDDQDEMQAMMTRAMGGLAEARMLVQNASYKLKSHPDGAIVATLPIQFEKWVFDEHSDDLFADLLMHQRMTKIGKHAREMAQAIDVALVALESKSES
jgi:hypothetical protein